MYALQPTKKASYEFQIADQIAIKKMHVNMTYYIVLYNSTI